jgi:hypothetical protein
MALPIVINNDSNFPPSNVGPYRIDRTWCLGDSLPYLNGNTVIFPNEINDLGTALASTSASLITNIASASSSTINSLSTVPYARLNDGNQSGIAPLYGCRAWVNFDMTRNASGGADTANTARYIRNQGNVSSVIRTSTNNFRITFTIPMPSNAYAFSGSGQVVNGYIWATTTPTVSSFDFTVSNDTLYFDNLTWWSIMVIG